MTNSVLLTFAFKKSESVGQNHFTPKMTLLQEQLLNK